MLIRGRETLAILTMMGVKETIAKSLDEYIEFAIKLERIQHGDNRYLKRLQRIQHRIYHDMKCITALEDFLESVVKERYEQDSKKDKLINWPISNCTISVLF